MNVQLLKLVSIAAAPSRVIAGLMSGTSLDGLDIALCEFHGAGLDTQLKVLHFITMPYEEDFKEELKAISFKDQADLQKVTLMNAKIGSYSAALIIKALSLWNFPVESVDLIASHGQTIFHAPISLHHHADWPNATLQIGDGDHIAQMTGVITLSDFRQKHIAAGGEGAPLAVYGDYLLFSSVTENRILLNIGGIANFTYLPAGRNPDLVFSTDAGPGNTLMDQFVQLHFPGKYFDKDAEIARSGQVSTLLVEALLDNEFFSLPFPKTTGPELFNMAYLDTAIANIEGKSSEINQTFSTLATPSMISTSSSSSTFSMLSTFSTLSKADILASLCEFTALAITNAIKKSVTDQSFKIYLSGGGMHNPLLTERISKHLGVPLNNTADLGIDPDAKEAVLFALLANECVSGGDTGYGSQSGMREVTMGKISLPG